MILLGISTVLFLLGQIGRLSLNNQEINLYLYEIPYFLWIGHQLILKQSWPLIRKETLTLVGVLIITYLLGIYRVAPFANLVSLLYLIRFTGYLLGFDLVKHHLSKGKLLSVLSNFWLAMLWLMGAVQYFLYSNLRNLQYLGWDPHQSRVFGQFFDTSVAGAVYGLILIFVLFRNSGQQKVIWKYIYSISYFLLGIFTYSRGFIVSIVASSFAQGIVVNKNLRLFVVLLASVVLFFFMAPTPFGEGVKLLRTSTIESRLVDYEQGIKLFLQNPVIGIGYNRIRYFKSADTMLTRGLSHAGASFHSSFLIIAVTSGLIGFGIFLYWLWVTVRMSEFALVSGVFIGVYSLFDNIILHPFILFLWPITIGLISRKKR